MIQFPFAPFLRELGVGSSGPKSAARDRVAIRNAAPDSFGARKLPILYTQRFFPVDHLPTWMHRHRRRPAMWVVNLRNYDDSISTFVQTRDPFFPEEGSMQHFLQIIAIITDFSLLFQSMKLPCARLQRRVEAFRQKERKFEIVPPP
ncbi:hypothetical protein ALC60_14443 [Trachymyrmex zeteki]|uniref:Uncharacterized protein n=1 Tax=Mycetomoellerius zeteki TaxID=64791 RepID=A0A151WFC6_9HYME|nr:hypothetical protein ALC60_14443 [Trachymyrmex zeteki]